VTVVRNLLVGLTAGALAALAPALGCGREARAPDSLMTASQGTRAERLDLPPLPEWAPENPSPEFLRAARVLKPVPIEEQLGALRGDQAKQALVLRQKRFWPALYEFFGTLSDEQVERFLASREEPLKILIPVKSLTTKQRAALDNWFEIYHKVNEGTMSPELKFLEDYRVGLYKLGANQDLSNVKVGFVAQGGHAVHILFCITRPDGSQDGACTQFAEM